MSEHVNNWINSQHENFKKKLMKWGVIEALTNILAKLYELEIKPTDPLEYIRTNMTEIISEKEELKTLKAKYNNMIVEIQEMEKENMNLEKKIKIKIEQIQNSN